MNLKQLEKLMQLMHQYDLQNLAVSDAETSIKLSRASASSHAAPLAVQPQVPQAVQPGAEPLAVGSSSMHTLDKPVEAAPTITTIATDAKVAARSAAVKEIRSPFVGTFYTAASPGSDPFVYPGKKVKKGDVLCIIEAMKLMNEIEAERDGTIVDILIANEEPVEYDQALFLFE